MPTLKIEYFASLREQAGVTQESFSGECSTYKDLYEKLSTIHGFVLSADMIQVAVNDEFASMSDPVIDGSKVVFIPPVAGG
jgi:molybdopterin synthase sulfur carrier subunit